MKRKRIILTVTNNLLYDQRMQRICTSLSKAGFDVTLVGRLNTDDPPLEPQPYQQHRIYCRAQKGKLFYLEFNLKLARWLWKAPKDIVCAIDLDTILPVYYITRWQRLPRIYDAHELFCEMKEIVSRPPIYRIWKWIEKKTVPHFRIGYTVNQPIADLFHEMYGVQYSVIPNMPMRKPRMENAGIPGYIYYQGAVNEGRCFEQLIPAMKWVDRNLVICGSGNFLERAQALAQIHEVAHKIQFKGMVAPADLPAMAAGASIGITLFDTAGKSNYLSLANRYFDYIQFGLPQLCVDYPVYRGYQTQYATACLIQDLSPENIAHCLNKMLLDPVLYAQMQAETLLAREEFCWEKEEQRLINLYQSI